MIVHNLTSLPDNVFLQQSTDALLAAIRRGDVWNAGYWAEHAASFASSMKR